MKILILTAILMTGCASVEVGGNTCSLGIAGDFDSRIDKTWLNESILQQAMGSFIASTTFATDERLMDPIQVCHSLSSFRVYTKKDYIFQNRGDKVFGYTQCWSRMIVVGTPPDNNWRMSPLVHQMYHVAQNCESPMPVDDGVKVMLLDEDDQVAHSNWIRAGIFNAIDIANKE